MRAVSVRLARVQQPQRLWCCGEAPALPENDTLGRDRREKVPF